MSPRYTCTSQPAAEPVSVADLRAWARLDDNGDDDVLTRLLLGARRRVELHTRRALITQTWTATLDAWPIDPRQPEAPWPFTTAVSSRRVRLAPVPIATITSVVVDAATIAAAQYKLAAHELVVKTSVADSTDELGSGIVITYTAGYGAAGSSVPAPLLEAILMIATDGYERRGEAVEGMLSPIPDGAANRMQPYVVWEL